MSLLCTNKLHHLCFTNFFPRKVTFQDNNFLLKLSARFDFQTTKKINYLYDR